MKKSSDNVQIDRLGRFGLDGSVNAIYKEKGIDQLQPHTDLLDDFKNGGNDNIDFKRMS